MKKVILVCGIAAMGILCLTECTKNIVPESPENSPALTGVIAEEVNSKTALEGVDVSWVKDDRIAVQLSDNHRENASPKAGYATSFGVYKLADDAAGGKVGKFIFDREDEKILGDEEFFAFYPASFCSGNPSNGYFYLDFPMTQHHEDNVGGKLQLPMYGIGRSRNIDFKYAGAVIVLRIWSETETKVHSCVINAKGGLAKKAFSYVQENGEWSSLQHAYVVSNLNLDMRNPLAVSTNEANPTEIVFVVPLAGTRTMENLKFSINCTEGGCELIKKSPLTIKPGSKVSFPVTEIKLDPNRMYVDELEGEIDFDWIKTAEKSVRVTMPSSARLLEETFRSIIEATKSLGHQIIVDLSGTIAKAETIQGLDNNQYIGFCGGSNRQTGISGISELRLPEGIKTIMNKAFANSDYNKIVLPATVTKISGCPANGCDKMVWEVNAENTSFKADDKGALYDYSFTTLFSLNGGSGEEYVVRDGTTQIREWALYENSVIKSLTIPATVTTMQGNCISGTPNLSKIVCLGATPAEFKPNTGANKVGPTKSLKTLYVPAGSVELYKEKWASLLKEGNWEVLAFTRP